METWKWVLIIYVVLAIYTSIKSYQYLYKNVGVRDTLIEEDRKYVRSDYSTLIFFAILFGLLWPLTFYFDHQHFKYQERNKKIL